MDFGANSVLERVAFGSKFLLYRVRVSQCRPSRVIKNPAEQPPLASEISETSEMCYISEITETSEIFKKNSRKLQRSQMSRILRSPIYPRKFLLNLGDGSDTGNLSF